MVEGVGLRADFTMGINLGLVQALRKVGKIQTVIMPNFPSWRRASARDSAQCKLIAAAAD